jgi:hypothetical protein
MRRHAPLSKYRFVCVCVCVCVVYIRETTHTHSHTLSPQHTHAAYVLLTQKHKYSKGVQVSRKGLRG